MPAHAQREQGSARLLQFLLPGLMHGLGNAVFSIHGHAQVLGTDDIELRRERVAILKAAEKAMHALEVLRYLQDDSGAIPCAQAGILLRRLHDFVLVPLRERGMRAKFLHSSNESPSTVDGVCLCRCVVETMRCLADVLPAGFEGEVALDLIAQSSTELVLSLRVTGQPTLLPFPLDLDEVVAQATPLLAAFDAALEGPDENDELRLHVPTLRPSEAPPGIRYPSSCW